EERRQLRVLAARVDPQPCAGVEERRHLVDPLADAGAGRPVEMDGDHRRSLTPRRYTAPMAKTILILVGPEYEDLEVWYPKLRLEEAGYWVRLAGTGEREYRGKHGYPCPVDGVVGDFPASGLAGIIAPGGWAPDKLRRDGTVLDRVRELHAAGKMV